MENKAHEMIRVNHAGEYGATRIYAGQLFVLRNDPTILHMAQQEKEHLAAFQRLAIERKVRPSLLQPFWHVGGFLMGALTAAAGRNVAHACTAAVEEVIDQHYQNQLHDLQNNSDSELSALVEQCHKDECEHRDTAEAEAGVRLDEVYPITTFLIKRITKGAIEISKRI
jgi:ubiquinone biosynthesis monooxygenase Coq7